MPHTLDPLPYEYVPAPKPVRWTRQQCAAMREAGILTERYELVEGEIILKMGQGSLHAYVIVRLTAWMLALFGPDFVRFQLPFRVTGEDRNGSEPEPDAVALTRPAADFLTENPDATFVTLVVEASDSSLQFDRVKKSALYARNGVPEYWVIDIEGRQIIAHRQPSAGGYEEILAYSADELIATLARPDAPVAVAALLPPLAAG